jgi:hypothetical protein
MPTKKRSQRKYGKAAGKSVKSAMHREKRFIQAKVEKAAR